MAGTKSASGIKPHTHNRTFEVALSLALNPGLVLRPSALATEMGLTPHQAQQVCRQLVDNGVAERIRPGWYRETVGLRRMVTMWTPTTEGSAK